MIRTELLKIIKSGERMSLDEITTEHLRTINGSWDYHIDKRHVFDDLSMDKIAGLIEKIEKNRGHSFEEVPLTVLQKYELLRGGEITFGAYLLFVKENLGCKLSLISETSGQSKRSIERSLARLREQNLIEFRGSPKKGGYFIVGDDGVDGGVTGGVDGGATGGVNGKRKSFNRN